MANGGGQADGGQKQTSTEKKGEKAAESTKASGAKTK